MRPTSAPPSHPHVSQRPPSTDDDSPGSSSQSNPKRKIKKKSSTLTASTTIITPAHNSTTTTPTTVLVGNSDLDAFPELQELSTATSNRTVVLSNCLPHLLTSIPIPNDLSYDITAITETDRVLTFPTRQHLVSFTTKYPASQFGPKAIYSRPPKSSKAAPWEKEICHNPSITHSAQCPESDASNISPDPQKHEPWQTATSRKNKSPKKNPIPSKPTDTSNPTTSTSTSSEHPKPPRHCLRISQHTINGNNPFFIHHLIHENELIIEQPRMFWARSTATTTLTFSTKDDLQAFTNKIHAKTFGPNATYTISQGLTQQQNATRPHDVSVVMRDVAISVPLDALTNALLDQHYHVKRIVRIISAQTHRPTDMVRIFVDDIDTSNRLLTGVTLFGRNYRVEASKELIRHRPCTRCAQYGHENTTCNNPAKCWKCGNDPAVCKHKNTDNIMFCATCSEQSHYTGQMMCPRYPKATPPTTTAPTHRPIYTPSIPPPPIVKPSQMADLFPALPTAATSRQRSYANATASLPQKQPESKPDIPDEPTIANAPTVSKPQQEQPQSSPLSPQNFHHLVKCVEQYIDDKINEQEEKLVTFMLAMFTTHTQPSKRLHHIKIANQAARRILKKTVRHQFINKHLQITLVPFHKVTSLTQALHVDLTN